MLQKIRKLFRRKNKVYIPENNYKEFHNSEIAHVDTISKFKFEENDRFQTRKHTIPQTYNPNLHNYLNYPF